MLSARARLGLASAATCLPHTAKRWRVTVCVAGSLHVLGRVGRVCERVCGCDVSRVSCCRVRAGGQRVRVWAAGGTDNPVANESNDFPSRSPTLPGTTRTAGPHTWHAQQCQWGAFLYWHILDFACISRIANKVQSPRFRTRMQKRAAADA